MRNMGQSVVVTLNRFSNDKEEEIVIVRQHCKECGVGFAMNEGYMKGGEGCMELCTTSNRHDIKQSFRRHKIHIQRNWQHQRQDYQCCKECVWRKHVVFKKSAMKALERIDEWGLGNYPVCIAKTQYSLSDDAKRYGVPKYSHSLFVT